MAGRERGSTGLDALRAAIDEAERVAGAVDAVAPREIRRLAEGLRAQLEAVLEQYADALSTDAPLQALVVRARTVHARLRVNETPAAVRARGPRTPATGEAARDAIDRYGLRRCAVCDGDVLLARDDAQLAAGPSALPLAVVVCARCGDVRWRVVDRAALERAFEDPEWLLVSLPGAGPFRSG